MKQPMLQSAGGDLPWLLRRPGRIAAAIVAIAIAYLLTIGLLFTGVILEKQLDEHSLWRIWVERACLFFGVTSFLFTFALPAALVQMQSARYDAEIERRRRDAGIDDDH